MSYIDNIYSSKTIHCRNTLMSQPVNVHVVFLVSHSFSSSGAESVSSIPIDVILSRNYARRLAMSGPTLESAKQQSLSNVF